MMGYHNTVWKDLKWSVRQNVLWHLAMDLILIVGGLWILPLLFSKIMGGVIESDPTYQFLTSNTAATITSASQIPDNLLLNLFLFLAKIIIPTAILIGAIYVLYCYTRGIIWNITVNKAYSGHDTKLFLKGNTLWIFIGLLPAFVVFALFSVTFQFLISIFQSTVLTSVVQVILWAYVLFIINMTFVFYYELARHKKVGVALKSMIDLSVKQSHHFIAPYVIAVICFLAVFNIGAWLLYTILRSLDLVNGWWEALHGLWVIILMLVLFAWLRYFVDAVVQRLSPHKKERPVVHASEVRKVSVKAKKPVAPKTSSKKGAKKSKKKTGPKKKASKKRSSGRKR